MPIVDKAEQPTFCRNHLLRDEWKHIRLGRSRIRQLDFICLLANLSLRNSYDKTKR